MFRFLFTLILLLPLSAQAAAGPWVETQNTRARLVSGDYGWGGVEIELAAGWKTYWRMPGDAGLPPRFDWSESENLGDAQMHWPAPARYTILGLDNIGYEKHVVFPVALMPVDQKKPMALRLNLDLLVCSDICIPESFSLALDILPSSAVSEPETATIKEALTKIPVSGLSESISLGAARVTEGFNGQDTLAVEVFLPAGPGENTDIFVEHDSGLVFGRPVTRAEKQGSIYEFFLPLNGVLPGGATLEQKLSAAPLRLTYVDEKIAYEISVFLVTAVPAASQSVLPILALALLGGLILNLMPCVLPVLSLKLLSVVSHGGDTAKKIRAGFLASAAGIVSSFLILALTIAALKSAGATVGWGLQFQHPAFLIFMIVLLLLFAANLWGLFEIPLPRFIAHIADKTHEHEPTMLGHFFTGALVTLLATPCTAPFLGTAVGFALSAGTAEILAVFAALGAGLALPYLAVAAFPAAVRLLPRPGHWMITLKKSLAGALVGTAAWLLWVAISIFMPSAMPAEGFWIRFDEKKIPALVAEGKTVFVDVTADWCLTCQANKKFVLDNKEIREKLMSENVVAMIADWTKPDPTISAYLKKFGRYGIPFNAVYGPGAPQGIALPELLSSAAVIKAIEKSQ